MRSDGLCPDRGCPDHCRPDPRGGGLGSPSNRRTIARLLTHLLTEDLLLQLYRGVVQSTMSEQLAHIAALRMAGDNARKLFDRLTQQHNLARQHAITEVSVGGVRKTCAR